MNQNSEAAKDTLLSSELIGKVVYSKSDRREVGTIQDLMIEPNLLEVAAIVTTKGDVVKRDLHMIPSGEVKTWGRDEILITKGDVIRNAEELPECEKWLSMSNQLVGQEVITTTGTRLGKLEDIVIDANGRVIGYELEETDYRKPAGYEGRTDHIPSVATHQMGSEVLMINARDLAWIIG